MSTVASTTLIAVTVAICATFGLCFHVLDVATWEWAVGIAGGGAGALHLSQVTNGRFGLSSSPSAAGGSPPGAG